MLSSMLIPIAEGSPLEHVVDHPLVQTASGYYLLTNHMVMMCVAAALMLIVFPLITKPYRDGKLVPTGGRNFFEAILMFIREDVARPVLAEHTDRFIPYLWTLFFFILFNNLLGLLPLDILTGHLLGLNHGHGIYGTATANIWMTGTLAIFAFILWHVSGIRANGLGGWAHHFLGGAPIFMAPIMIIVEAIGMIVKPVALAIRLMANMVAGHVLLAVLVSFVGLAAAKGAALMSGVGIAVIIGSTAIMVLELFVAFLQAYLFTFLTSLFIGQMVVLEGEHDSHEHDAAHGHAHDDGINGDLTDMEKLGEGAKF